MTKTDRGVYVNVPDTLGYVTVAFERAARDEDTALEDAARTVMSALMLHIGSRFATLPPEVRPYYDQITT